MRARGPRTVWVTGIAAALLCASAVQVARSPSAVPARVLEEGYAGSDSCRACHASNHASWSASYHPRMTQSAGPASILAPWEGTTPPFGGLTWRLSRDADRFLAQPLDASSKPIAAAMRAALTTGSHHYQIYWLESDGAAELVQLPLVWHLGERRWIPRQSLFLAPPPESPFAETGRWPKTCVKCHTTNATPRHPDDERTHVAELGIACEACHGPGAAHVALQSERAGLDADAVAALPPDATIVNPAELSHERSAQACGQCHGIHPQTKERRAEWEVHGYAYRPGDDLAATRDLLRAPHAKNTAELQGFLARNPGTLDDVFWSDGHVRVSGREYNGLVESPCFQRGEMDCLSCHALHKSDGDARSLAQWADDQLRPGMDGPRACLQCHDEYADAEKARAHMHHAPGSSGADCLNCHMPYTTYGLTKAIRSHTVASPSIAATLATGRPDACSQCHLDRTLGWAADHLRDWYGHARPALDADQETVAASVLGALTGDAGQRALWAWSFGWEPARAVSGAGWIPPLLGTLMQDPYDAVRFVAMRSARRDARHGSFTIDFTQPIDAQRAAVRADYVRAWKDAGLSATPEQRAAVLVGADGQLDTARFLALYQRANGRVMQLAE